MEYVFVCGGSACVQFLSCAAPVVIETSVMNKTCDPVSIRVQGCDPEFRVPGLVFVAGGGGQESDRREASLGRRTAGILAGLLRSFTWATFLAAGV